MSTRISFRYLDDWVSPCHAHGYYGVTTQEDVYQLMKALYEDEEQPVNEIARFFSKSYYAVRRHLVAMNVSFRPQGGHNNCEGLNQYT